MASDPALARQLKGMRADRMALASLADEKAPSGLIASVESALQPVLERQLLLGLEDGEPSESRPVVSMVRPEKRSIFQTFLADRVGRRMAMAASLLLLIGGGTYWATTMLSRSPQQPVFAVKPKDLTVADASPNRAREAALVPPAALKQPAAETKPGTPGPIELAKNDTKPDVDNDVKVPPAAPEVALASAASDVLVGPVKTPVDAALAAELARDRKLIIRVIPTSTPTVAMTERLKKDCKGTGWKLGTDVPTELASALEVRTDDAPIAPDRGVDHTVMVDSNPIAAALDENFVGPPMPQNFDIASAAGQSVYLVQARLDAATFAQIRSTLQKVGDAKDVVFEERYEALPIDSSGPILVPGAVVWWDSQPSSWNNWGEVPVVIGPR